MSSGGARPGAGRKAAPDKKVNVTLSVSPSIRLQMTELRQRGVPISKEFSELIEQLYDRIEK